MQIPSRPQVLRAKEPQIFSREVTMVASTFNLPCLVNSSILSLGTNSSILILLTEQLPAAVDKIIPLENGKARRGSECMYIYMIIYLIADSTSKTTWHSSSVNITNIWLKALSCPWKVNIFLCYVYDMRMVIEQTVHEQLIIMWKEICGLILKVTS